MSQKRNNKIRREIKIRHVTDFSREKNPSDEFHVVTISEITYNIGEMCRK